jgi:thiamine pyrophosphokinase
MKTLLAWIGSDRVEILHGPKKLDSTAPIGSTLSLIPLGGSAHGVTTAGLMWNLDNEELSAHSARSVSNRVKKTSIQISIDRGVLAIVYPCFLTTPQEHESSQQ